MFLIDNFHQHDPTLNMALEEYAMRHLAPDEEFLLLYINAPSVIVGCHQNLFEEVNRAYLERHQIPVYRRLSGGGTVYHDLGNLVFSRISPYEPQDFMNFKKFTAPVIHCLNQWGVPAELNGRSDILVAGKKVSGNAQYVSRGRMLTHGTLLFASDLAGVSEALRAPENIYTSKAIQSVHSPVTNISSFVPQSLDIIGLRDALLEAYSEDLSPVKAYSLTEADWGQVHKLAEERYRTWAWTYGHSPAFSVQKQLQLPQGLLAFRIEVSQGLIQSIALTANFLEPTTQTELQQALLGVRYDHAPILTALQGMSAALPLFPGFAAGLFTDFLF